MDFAALWPAQMSGSARVRIEIVNTGAELLLGRVLNSHQQFLCRRLADFGCAPERQICVSDDRPAIEGAIRESLERADVVITTGGLGPTSDDRTRDRIAALLGRKLTVDKTVLKRIQDFFCSRHRPMPESTAIQAQVPDGAMVLLNEHGTAPGLIMEVPAGKFKTTGSWLIMLPGPPRELRPMFDHQVLPWLKKQLPVAGFVCRTLKSCGVGESRVEEMIAPRLQSLVSQGLEIGYCARTGEVDVRFTCCGEMASTLVAEAERLTRAALTDAIFGVEDDQLETVVVRLLTQQKTWVALAESCTGGFIANRVTNVPGASAVLWGGCVTYANEAKMKLLGVSEDTLRQFGAVSEQTAREMAEGVRRLSGCDYALSVTGIAGPGGGTDEKPVGTVFIGLSSANGTQVKHSLNPFDRETFKYVTSQQALELLRRSLLKAA